MDSNVSFVYELCKDILADACDMIFLDDKIYNKEEKLIAFLVDDKIYNELFRDYHVFGDNISVIKKYMMLLVVSTSYKLNNYNILKDIELEISKKFISYIETLDPDEIFVQFQEEYEKYSNYLKMAKEKGLSYDEDYEDNYLGIVDTVGDYYSFYEKNFIFQNDSLMAVYKFGKIKTLFKINPFEHYCFMDYIMPKMITEPERIICDFIDIVNSAISNCIEKDYDESEEEFEDDDDIYFIDDRKINLVPMRALVLENVKSKFNKNNELEQRFYGYILGSVYENIKINKADLTAYGDIITYFEDPKVDANKAIDRFKNDSEFFCNIVNIFINGNKLVQDLTLQSRRKEFKDTDGVGVLKKFNSYYEYEEQIFKSQKVFEKEK